MWTREAAIAYTIKLCKNKQGRLCKRQMANCLSMLSSSCHQHDDTYCSMNRDYPQCHCLHLWYSRYCSCMGHECRHWLPIIPCLNSFRSIEYLYCSFDNSISFKHEQLSAIMYCWSLSGVTSLSFKSREIWCFQLPDSNCAWLDRTTITKTFNKSSQCIHTNGWTKLCRKKKKIYRKIYCIIRLAWVIETPSLYHYCPGKAWLCFWWSISLINVIESATFSRFKKQQWKDMPRTYAYCCQVYHVDRCYRQG